MGCAPVALVFLLVARAATACRSTSLGVDLPDTGVTLAPGIVAVDAFVQQDSIAAILAALPNGPQWYPCPRQESSFPSKRCSKLGVDRVPALAALRTKLSATWRTLNFDRLTHVAVAMDKPSNTSSMRHAYHRDVFPERRGDAPRPSATMIIYLTAPAQSIPIEDAGATIFPDAGLQLRPLAGRLLAWANECADGTPAPNGRHGVGAYRAQASSPPRVALHIPIEHVTPMPEHVGCSASTKRIYMASWLSGLLDGVLPSPHTPGKHRIAMLLMRLRMAVLFVVTLIVFRRKQARYYAACLRGAIGGGVAIKSQPSRLLALAQSHLRRAAIGRLPNEVLETISGFCVGASNPYVASVKKAEKQLLVTRLDQRTRQVVDPADDDGRILAMVQTITRLGRIDFFSVASAVDNRLQRRQTGITPILSPTRQAELATALEGAITAMHVSVQRETEQIHSGAIAFPPYRGEPRRADSGVTPVVFPDYIIH